MAPGQDPLGRHRVKTLGNQDAHRAMVFVHGFGEDQTAWTEVAGAFLGDFRVVLLDNAGAGRSAPDAFTQSHYLGLDRYATDLVEVCEALALTDAVLVGHSAGGMMALLAAIGLPRVVSRLVMIGASPCYLDEPGYHGGFTDADLKGLYRLMLADYTQWADQFALLAMGDADGAHLATYFANRLKTIPPDHALTVLCSIFQSDCRLQLPLVQQPTLVIQSRQDFAVPMAVAEYLHAQISASRLVVVDATGHFPHLTAAPQVIAAIRAFLETPI